MLFDGVSGYSKVDIQTNYFCPLEGVPMNLILYNQSINQSKTSMTQQPDIGPWFPASGFKTCDVLWDSQVFILLIPRDRVAQLYTRASDSSGRQ